MSERTLIERTERLALQECPSMKEWVLSVLYEHGMHTLDDLAAWLPETNWAQLLLAIDGLSRDGVIELRRVEQGDYVLALRDPG